MMLDGSIGRRGFLRRTGAAAAAAALSHITPTLATTDSKNVLPRWRGFNLMEFFQAFSVSKQDAGQIRENDLKWMRDWGFDFVRLPMDYWLWIDTDWRKTKKLTPDDVYKFDESMLAKVDRAVELGTKFGLHVSLNFHRAPGYCINNAEREPFVLWRDKQAEDAFAFHWETFAKRYRAVPNDQLSFNLVNEAPTVRKDYMSAEDYRRVMTRATEAIRKHSPNRMIIIDGLNVGNVVVENMISTGVAQSVHAYTPAGISHYRASWVDRDSTYPTPSWPLKNKDGSVDYNRQKLEEHYAPWGRLVKKGIGVHCGEAGCYNKTPYDVFYRWFADVMEILKGHEIGYALWNFRGPFGILDSGRQDVELEGFSRAPTGPKIPFTAAEKLIRESLSSFTQPINMMTSQTFLTIRLWLLRPFHHRVNDSPRFRGPA
jgi:endoglucanase